MTRQMAPKPKLTSKGRLAAACMAIFTSFALSQVKSGGNASSPPSAASALAFEVASIRQNVSVGGRNHIMSSAHDARFATINAPLMSILQFAFNIPQSRILDAPAWVKSEKFDIEAKADSLDDELKKLSWEDGKLKKQQMVQVLLADRFQLKVHHETRELATYALVVDKNGSKLQAAKADGCMINTYHARIQISGCDSMTVLAESLAENLGRVVIDKTDLKGRYDLDLKWTPDDGAAPMASGGASTTPDSGPSIFTALQEQFGLKLESQKSPVDVLVVDHVEQPSAN